MKNGREDSIVQGAARSSHTAYEFSELTVCALASQFVVFFMYYGCILPSGRRLYVVDTCHSINVTRNLEERGRVNPPAI